MNKFWLFLMIVFFGGSSVVIAGRDMYNRVKHKASSERVAAAALIQDLRGDRLEKKGEKYIHSTVVPERKYSSILPDRDRAMLSSFFNKLSEPADEK